MTGSFLPERPRGGSVLAGESRAGRILLNANLFRLLQDGLWSAWRPGFIRPRPENCETSW